MTMIAQSLQQISSSYGIDFIPNSNCSQKSKTHAFNISTVSTHPITMTAHSKVSELRSGRWTVKLTPLHHGVRQRHPRRCRRCCNDVIVSTSSSVVVLNMTVVVALSSSSSTAAVVVHNILRKISSTKYARVTREKQRGYFADLSVVRKIPVGRSAYYPWPSHLCNIRTIWIWIWIIIANLLTDISAMVYRTFRSTIEKSPQ